MKIQEYRLAQLTILSQAEWERIPDSHGLNSFLKQGKIFVCEDFLLSPNWEKEVNKQYARLLMFWKGHKQTPKALDFISVPITKEVQTGYLPVFWQVEAQAKWLSNRPHLLPLAEKEIEEEDCVPDTITMVLPKLYPYSTNVLSLASNKKQKEVQEDGIKFGIELEFKFPDASLRDMFVLTNMGAFKSDSSVKDGGEFVTLPYTYSQMVSKIKGYQSTFDLLLSENGSDDNGMHVHVTRSALSKKQMLNLQTLLNPSTKEGKQYWSQVAGRQLEGNRWCGFTDLEYWNKEGGGGLYNCDRYVTVNFTNKHTVEFRMFKSPTKSEKVLWNLALVNGLIEFSKTSDCLEEWHKSPLNPAN